MSYEKHTWVNNEAITASKMNNIEYGIEEASQSGGGGKYDAYDFIISQVDTGTPVLVKGTWQDIYDALQNMEHVVGLYLWNSTPNAQWHDTVSLFVPLTYVMYYSSADKIYGGAIYLYDSNRMKVTVGWSSDDSIIVEKGSV
jgi:hypothetical protein